MQIPLAYVTLIVVYYIPRVSCGHQCFTIDQVQVFNDTGADYLPCNSAASISNCCPEGWICLSNGLCEASGNSSPNHGLTSLYTGFCTDPFWSNGTVCPKICNNNATRKNLLRNWLRLFHLELMGMTDWIVLVPPNAGNGVVPCGDGNFCCYGLENDECCGRSSAVFFLGVATRLTTGHNSIPTSTAPTDSTPNNTIFTRTTSVSALAIPSTTSSIRSASPVDSALAVASTSIAPSTPKTGSDQPVAIAIGVGVAVGLVIIALAGFFYFKPRRSKRRPERLLYVNGENEREATSSERENTRAHEVEADRRVPELGAENVAAEVGEWRAEMG